MACEGRERGGQGLANLHSLRVLFQAVIDLGDRQGRLGFLHTVTRECVGGGGVSRSHPASSFIPHPSPISPQCVELTFFPRLGSVTRFCGAAADGNTLKPGLVPTRSHWGDPTSLCRAASGTLIGW